MAVLATSQFSLRDSFGARYYSSSLGRFLSPDWSDSPQPIPYANLENPQSLNLYSYVLNNPASATDPDGHICCFGWLPSAYRWVSGVLDGFTGTPSNSETPPAGNCGNPCVVNSTAMRVPLAETRALAVGMALAWGRIAPRPLTQAELQSLARQPVHGASPFMPPEGDIAAGLEKAETVLAEARETGAAPGLVRSLGEHIQKLKEYIADPFGRDNRGFLSDPANADRQAGIYSSRVRRLLRQIDNFAQQIKEWRGGSD